MQASLLMQRFFKLTKLRHETAVPRVLAANDCHCSWLRVGAGKQVPLDFARSGRAPVEKGANGPNLHANAKAGQLGAHHLIGGQV